jgi:hypothetical protein
MMPVPQCLQVIFTFLPRTFSSGTAYLAEHDVQLTFMKSPEALARARHWSKRASPQVVKKYHDTARVAKPTNFSKYLVCKAFVARRGRALRLW